MKCSGFEILTKHGKTVLENGGVCYDKIDTAKATSLQGARDYRAIQKHKFPNAVITIRDADTLVRVA